MEQKPVTLPENISSLPFFLFVLVAFVLFNVVKLHVFTFLVPCYYVRYDFHVKRCSVRLCFFFYICYVLFIFFVFIYAYCCPTRFPCQMSFVSLNSNRTDVTSGEGNGYLSGVPEFIPVLVGFVLFDL